MDQQLRCVFVASGEIQAVQVRAFLEAAGISSAERGESLRHTHGFTIDGLGAVEMLGDRSRRPSRSFPSRFG